MMKGLSSSDPQATVPQRTTSDTGETAVLAVPLAAPRMPVVPGYELLQVLGEGSHGIVYLACQLSLGNQVALKMLRHGDSGEADERRLLRRDAEVLAKLDHPNIVRIIDLGEADGRLFYSMEYVTGRSLAERLDTGPLPPREAARLVEAAARALHAVHQQHIIHRDLNPANILLDEHGTPKVADFGLAKRLGADTSLAASGQLVGNIAHMAPEQSEGKPESVGPTADVWALGVILYESLSGRIPFAGKSFLETLDRIRHAEPAPLRTLGVDRDLQTICWKCLEKDPARRSASAEALADDLKCWQAGEPIVARPQGWMKRLQRSIRRQRIKVAVALAVLITVAVVLATSTFMRGPTPEEQHARQQQQALAEIEGDLEAGRPVNLIPPKSGPRYYRWRSGSPTQTFTTTRDGTFSIQSMDFGLLKLLANPHTDMYRFEAEVRHESADDVHRLVGIYFGYSNFTTAQGLEHCCATVKYSDKYEHAKMNPKWPYPGNFVRLKLEKYSEPSLRTQSFDPSVELFFPAVNTSSPAPWRHLTVELRPTEVRMAWENEPPCTLSRDRIQEYSRQYLNLESGMVPAFSPRERLGLYVFAAAAYFRNVRVIPQDGQQ